MNDLVYSVASLMFNAAMQASVDALGQERTFLALKPYQRHNAKYCLSIAPSIVGVVPSDIENFLTFIHWFLYMPHQGKNRIRIDDNGDIEFEVLGCRQNGAYPWQCQWYCEREIPLMCEESNLDLSMKMERSRARGDDRCSWIIV